MAPPASPDHDLPSPSATCFQRKMSAMLTTHDDVDHHDSYHEGRPKIFLSKSLKSKSSISSFPRPAMIFKRASTVPMEQDHEQHPHSGYHDFCRVPSPLGLEYWSDPPASSFKVSSNWLGINIVSEQ